MDLTESIIPRSDQINADDLIAGPITVTITDAYPGGAEQPVDITLAETPGRAYRLLQSPDLNTWSEVSWHPAGADGAFTVTLPTPTDGPPQFFIWETH